MHIVYGVAGYATLANIFFLLSGFASDLLLIRIWLVCSYTFLLVLGALGYPPWGEWGQYTPSVLELGGILWPACVLILHLYHVVVLVLDERPITFASDDEEQLWRLFYRRSGMGRLEMRIALKLGEWKRYRAGDVIFEADDHEKRLSLHIMVDGVAEYERFQKQQPSPLYSGFLFDLKLGNAWGVYLGQEQSGLRDLRCDAVSEFQRRAAASAALEKESHLLPAPASFHFCTYRRAVAVTDCLVFEWSFEAVQQMTGQASPALAAFWRNYLLYSVGSAFSDVSGELYSSNGEVEQPSVKLGGRTRDMDPLLPHERPRRTVGGFLSWLARVHNPIPPSGQRHQGMPPSGMLAHGRVLAEASDFGRQAHLFSSSKARSSTSASEAEDLKHSLV